MHVQPVGDALAARPGGAANVDPSSPEHAYEQALDAATDAARLVGEYASDVASTDAARDAFAAQILGAGTALNARLVGWLAEEGASAAHATERGSRASNATLLEVAEMGLEAASMANPVSAAAMIAIDLGWDFVEAGMGNDRRPRRERTRNERRVRGDSTTAGRHDRLEVDDPARDRRR